MSRKKNVPKATMFPKFKNNNMTDIVRAAEQKYYLIGYGEGRKYGYVDGYVQGRKDWYKFWKRSL